MGARTAVNIMIRRTLTQRRGDPQGPGTARVEAGIGGGRAKISGKGADIRETVNQTLILKMAWYGTTKVQTVTTTMTRVESISTS